MSDPGIKISYAAALFRVRVEFSRAATMASPLPPADVLQRARAKLESVLKEKHIGFIVTYEQRLERAWTALRDASGEPESTVLGMTLAAGAPDIQEIYVDPPGDDAGRTAALVTISAAPALVAGWKFEWVKLCVAQRMRELRLPGPANAAQLQSAMLKAIQGEKVEKFPVSALSAIGPAEDKSKFFSIVANKGRREVALIVRDIKPLLVGNALESLLQTVEAAAAKMSAATGDDYFTTKKDIQFALKNAMSGPERVGLDLPQVLLAAYGLKRAGDQKSKPAAGPRRTNYAGAGKLEITTDESKMEAVVTNFSKKLYDDPSFQVNPEWLNNELDRLGVVFGREPELHKTLAEKMKVKEDLTGLCVARGQIGVGAKGPFIYPSFQDAGSNQAASGLNMDKDVLNIREMQQRNIVKIGQLVAEIRYANPPQPGTTVFGAEIPPDNNEALMITLGEGVQSRDMQKFYATADGIPVIEGTTIALSKIFVHNGDVNLRSGNIRFEGPVEIKGSVDAGALVDVKGHLIIHGSIRGGTVICSESVEVSGGVVTGPTAYVKVRGNFSSEFIENSRVTCSGDIKAKKAILNSEIIAGEGVEVLNGDGIVAGGIISARHTLKTANLGFRRGAATDINVGVDFRIELRIRSYSGRLAKVTAKLAEDRQTLRELVSKKKEQMTARHEEMKARLQKRLGKGRIIIEKIEAALAAARGLLVYDQNSKIIVAGTLAQNCKITCGGNGVAITHEVAGVAITPKRRRGSFIIAIEDLEKDEGGGGNGSGGKKAS